MILVLVASIALAGVFLLAAHLLDRTPDRAHWRALWPEAFSGELAVLAAWLALRDGHRPTPAAKSTPEATTVSPRLEPGPAGRRRSSVTAPARQDQP